MVADQTTIVHEPAKGAFNDPALGEENKSSLFLRPDNDFKNPVKDIHDPYRNPKNFFYLKTAFSNTLLPLLSVCILELAKAQGRVTTQEIEQITGESRSTIKARLKQLTTDRLLIRYGQGRSTWYGLN
jgi:predicted HTH transcriptional regulator